MSFWRTYYHLVWSTKNWEPLINEEVEAVLFSYLESKAAELGVHVHAINGWTDHVHMVASIPPKLALAQVEANELYIGFFSIGAYQEMLGGVRGSKHCVLPEANELIVDLGEEGGYQFEVIPGQEAADVLRNLGYAAT